ncbi:MAG: transcription elongation factor GreA [Spirochaetia bacterium]
MAEQTEQTEQAGQAEAVVGKITGLLNEEKWTRAALNNYTISNFKELDAVLEEVFASEAEEDVLEAAEEHLGHTKNSIIGLYISGIIVLSRQIVNDTNLISLIRIFSDNHKWNIVEYLANRILQYGENKTALQTLAECYRNENQEEKVYDVWERLIRVDYEEADIVRHLAEYKMDQGETDDAIDYYKKALHRYINKKSFTSIRDIWHILINNIPEETEFFYHAEGKVAKTISPDRSVQLLEDLHPYFQGEKNWNTAIDIIKRILEYDPKNAEARKNIIECYKNKYKGHSHLEEYIKVSNLAQSWRNVHDAISDFEKHIAFDAGNFVFHRSWGVGRIKSIKDDEIVIDFVKRRSHSMSLKMAVNALDILGKQHIWVLKSVTKKEKLKKKVKEDPSWALRTIIRSYNNAADMKKIKNELVPAILTNGEWTTWSTEARKILKTDSSFGNLPDKLDHFVVRDQPISFEEKTFNKFKAEKDFFDRIDTINDFMNEERADTDSDFFREMFEYFASFLKTSTTVNEYVVASNLLIKRILHFFPYLNPGVNLDFREMYTQIEDIDDIFNKLNNNDLRKDFILQIRKHIKNWPDIYVRLFPNYLNRQIIDQLRESGHIEKLEELIFSVYDNYREYREPFVWIAKNCADEEWFKDINITYEKILIAMIHLLAITYRDINNRRDVSFNRKVNRQIQNFLFKENRLQEFILTVDEDSISRIYTLVEDVKDLDPSITISLKHKIIEKYPDFKFFGKTTTDRVSRGFYTTSDSYDKKQKKLQHIIDVEVPENSKEIGEARELGDLKENAEYKAAKERQVILSNTVTKLKEDIEKAQVLSMDDIDTSVIGFGTKVTLKNEESGEKEVYTIMGPWESDPSNQVLSYMSPFGGELSGHKTGDTFEFTINNKNYKYTVEKIEPVKL